VTTSGTPRSPRREYRSVQSGGFVEGLAVPRAPIDRVLRVLAKVRTRGTREAIGHRSSVEVTWSFASRFDATLEAYAAVDSGCGKSSNVKAAPQTAPMI